MKNPTAMATSFPFYSDLSENDGTGVYHTHPRCRVGQGIALNLQVPGTGYGRRQCPFCFVLGQFEASRKSRKQSSTDARVEYPFGRETGASASSAA